MGTHIKASGTNFRPIIAASIGGVACIATSLTGDTVLDCTAPELPGGPPRIDFTITNTDGTSATLSAAYMPQGREVSRTQSPGVTQPPRNASPHAWLMMMRAAHYLWHSSTPAPLFAFPPGLSLPFPFSSLPILSLPSDTAAAPTITYVSPSMGSYLGDVQLTIQGTNFRSGLTVTVGGVECASVTLISDKVLHCVTAPLAAPGPPAADLVVINADETTCTFTGAYTPRGWLRRPPPFPLYCLGSSE